MTSTITRRVAWLTVSAILLISMLVKAEDAKSTKIILSPETTRILEPLNPDGTVNYLEAINSRYSKGVTPENNAAILLLQLVGPEILPGEIRDTALKRLGIAELPQEGKYFRRSDGIHTG